MSVKLREFIRQVRASRTAAEERAVVARECARIRTNFREGDSRYRHRDVAKVLFISMLGYPTQFAQVECLKLVASSRFAEKRVGYLGLTLLLDESSEVSMLATNSLKQDLQHTNQYVSSLALSALANGASPEVCRSLLPEVEQLLACSNPFIRKKAALAADLREECRQQLLQPLVKALRTCSSASYTQSAEYDIAGIVDPLLQSRLLRAVANLAEGDAAASAALTDVLAHVATNTDGSKNAGNCVLFECVRAIVSLETDQGLRVLGLNILGRFLSSREQNLKYVALETLQQLLKTDSAAVNRHRDTLLDCLKDGDSSIRRRAMEVLFALLSPDNIRVLGRELLAFLLVCDKESKPFVASRLARAAEAHAPTKRWQLDATLKLLCLAGNYVEDAAGHDLLDVVLSTPELQSYAVHKLFFCLREGSATNPVLCRVALYCVGEFGELLVAADKSHLLTSEKPSLQSLPLDPSEDASASALAVTSAGVVETLAEISEALLKGRAGGGPSAGGAAAVAAAEAASASLSSSSVTEALLTCLAKLTTRLPEQRGKLIELLRSFTSSRCLEVQQRSAEFVALLESPDWAGDAAALFERMPLQQQQKQQKQQRPVGEVCFDVADLPSELCTVGEAPEFPGPTSKPAATNGTGAALLELDDLLGLGDSSTSPQEPSPPPFDAVASGAAASTAVAPGRTAGLDNGLDLLADLLGGASVSPSPADQPRTAPTAVGVSSVVPEAAAGSTAQKPADTFAGLLDLGSPVASAAPAPPVPTPQIPLASALGSVPSPASLPPTADAPGKVADLLSLVLNAATPAAPAAVEGVSTVQVLQEEGLRVELKCRAGPTGSCEILAEFATGKDSKPLTQFRFEAAVPKYLQLHLEPPTDDVLLPGASPVQQRMRVCSAPAATTAETTPPNGPKPLLMKCRITFLRDGALVQKCANVSNFPPSLLGS